MTSEQNTTGCTNCTPDMAPMTTGELLEFAAADALGLLDDAERASFDRAFAAAPSSVRELIRAEQASVAELGLVLPDVDPDPAMRAKVLARIRAEIERAQTAPAAAAGSAATRGAGVRTASHGAGDRSGSGLGFASRPEPRSLGLRRAKRVSAFWRVAAVGASVGAVVLAVLQVQLRQEFRALESRSEIASLIDAIGIEHVEDALFNDHTTQRVQFAAVGSVGRAEAMLLRNPDRDKSRLYVMNLASRTSYRVVALDEAGEVSGEIASFESDDLLTGVDVALPGAAGEMVRVAIMSEGDDPTVLFVAEFRLA